MQHLFDIKQLTADQIHNLIDKANGLLTNPLPKAATTLSIANLFFEPSTRTSLSFQLAAQRLAIPCLTPHMASSSLTKGESVLDTINTIAAMGINTFVVRHHENGIMVWLTEQIPSHCHLINAGEGWLQHPSQALLDLMTLQQYQKNWDKLSIAIIGDLRHSRVARSLIDGLSIMGVRDIRIIAPEPLRPEQDVLKKVQNIDDIDSGIAGVDAIVCLRLQKERMSQGQLINESNFYQYYGLTNERLSFAKPHAIVLHPGPINRNIEISSEVANGPQSVILQQVTNGVAMRMAILEQL